MMGCGEQCAVTYGAGQMLLLYAVSWDIQALVNNRFKEHL